MSTVSKERPGAQPVLRFTSSDEFRTVLDEALKALDSDERCGPRFRATGMRVRFEFPDIASTLDLAAAVAEGHNLRWMFGASDWGPKLCLRMDSDVANGVLQGRESLAIGVARGRVSVSGEPLSTLLFVPALKLLVEPYRRAIKRLLPGLALE